MKMAKSKTSADGAGKAPRRRKLIVSDPPVLVGGGGSALVFFKNGATEIPSTKPGYRCFRVPGDIKNLTFYDGETPGVTVLAVKNSKSFFTQADE
jgi:hypothetical protein